MANTTGKSAWSNSGAFFVALFRRQRGTVVDGQIPLAFQAVEPQRYLVGMLPRGGDTTEVCIIRVPVRHGQAFAVDDFVGWRALVQGEPQPERQDLPVGVEGRDNVYSFGHTDHLYFIIQTYVRKINRENSDFADHVVALSDGSVALQAKDDNVVKRLQIHGWDNNVSYFYSDDGGLTWTEGVALLKASDLKYQLRPDLGGADVCTLPAGRWCVGNGAANGEIGSWYVEVIVYDDYYRTVHAYPYISAKKYYYFAKMDHGVWQGWEKYTSGI